MLILVTVTEPDPCDYRCDDLALALTLPAGGSDGCLNRLAGVSAGGVTMCVTIRADLIKDWAAHFVSAKRQFSACQGPNSGGRLDGRVSATADWQMPWLSLSRGHWTVFRCEDGKDRGSGQDAAGRWPSEEEHERAGSGPAVHRLGPARPS